MQNKTTQSLLKAIHASKTTEQSALRDALITPKTSYGQSFAEAREKRDTGRLDVDIIVPGDRETRLPSLRKKGAPAVKLRRLSKRLGTADPAKPTSTGVDMNAAAFGALVAEYRHKDMTDHQAAMHMATRLLDDAAERHAQAMPNAEQISMSLSSGKIHAISRVRDTMRLDDYMRFEPAGVLERPERQITEAEPTAPKVSITGETIRREISPIDAVSMAIDDGRIPGNDPRKMAALIADTRRGQASASDNPYTGDPQDAIRSRDFSREDRGLLLRALALGKLAQARRPDAVKAASYEDVGMELADKGYSDAAMHFLVRGMETADIAVQHNKGRAARDQISR